MAAFKGEGERIHSCAKCEKSVMYDLNTDVGQ